MATTTEVDVRTITLPEIKEGMAIITVEGITPLLQHRWSEKARKMIEDKQQKKAQTTKEARDPELEFREAMYVVPGHEGEPVGTEGIYYHPGAAFKQASVEACRVIGDKTFPMTKVKSLFFVVGDPILTFSEIVMRTDMARIGQGTSTPVYRPEFRGWGADVHVSYNSAAITLEQVVQLFALGGFHNGIGEWRPSSPKGKNGEMGRFRVASVQEVRS